LALFATIFGAFGWNAIDGCRLADKIRDLARRGEAWGNLESRQALEHAIEMGRTGIYFRLTPEQYAKLRRFHRSNLIRSVVKLPQQPISCT
jgi:hypothetical protein